MKLVLFLYNNDEQKPKNHKNSKRKKSSNYNCINRKAGEE